MADSLSGDEDHFIYISNADPISPCFGETSVSKFEGAIRYQGLVRLPDGPHHFYDSITSHHFDVFYVSPEVADTTLKMAKYFFESYGRKLRINSASLIYGGLYDTNANWRRPHQLHRIGGDVDVDAGLGPTYDTPEWFRRQKEAGMRASFRTCEPHPSSAGGRLDHVHCFGRKDP